MVYILSLGVVKEYRRHGIGVLPFILCYSLIFVVAFCHASAVRMTGLLAKLSKNVPYLFTVLVEMMLCDRQH